MGGSDAREVRKANDLASTFDVMLGNVERCS